MTGSELDEALAALGWSRSHLASLLGCDEALVRKWAWGGAVVPPPVGRWLGVVMRGRRVDPLPAVPEWRVRSITPA